jgi:hypothetical protein
MAIPEGQNPFRPASALLVAHGAIAPHRFARLESGQNRLCKTQTINLTEYYLI